LRTEADARVRHELRGSATDFPRRYSTVLYGYRLPAEDPSGGELPGTAPLHDWWEVASPLSAATAAAVCQ